MMNYNAFLSVTLAAAIWYVLTEGGYMKCCQSNSSIEMKIAGLPIEIHPEVLQALKEGKPVVALESTIISHGMPYPENLKTTEELERIVREEGCIPAIIAIIHSKICVGLNEEQLHLLATSKNATKVSRRDISYLLSQPYGVGGTTVSATMVVANMVGIKVFVTGGIGGVHRRVEETMDISADLRELGRTPVTVVCAGVKSILDIPKTLEYLETEGVTVIGFGKKEFAGFFTSGSGSFAPITSNSTKEIAEIIHNNHILKLNSGILISNPIPDVYEKELGMGDINLYIEEALRSADEQSIKGKEITPYLLAKINELSHGKSLTANIFLVKNNAKVGSQIAREYALLSEQKKNHL